MSDLRSLMHLNLTAGNLPLGGSVRRGRLIDPKDRVALASGPTDHHLWDLADRRRHGGDRSSAFGSPGP